MPESKSKTLAEKLAEACDAVGGVEKKGINEGQRYKYVKAADIAKAIRHELFSRGIIILQNEQKPEYIEIELAPDRDNKPRKMFEVRLGIQYQVTDGVTTINLDAYGVARDSGDKAIWKAKTGALKYFLRGLGLIPDEKDDPEYDKKGHHAEDSDEEEDQEVPVIQVAGKIIAETADKNYYWFKLAGTLDEKGEGLDEIRVASHKSNGECELSGKIDWLAQLKVRQIGSTTGKLLYMLVEVVKTLSPDGPKPSTTAKTEIVAPRPASGPATVISGNGENPAEPANKWLISEERRKRMFAIAGKVENGVARLDGICKAYGFNSKHEITPLAYPRIIEELELLETHA